MDKQDVIADLALKDLAKIDKLKDTVHQPAYIYYLRGGILGLLGAFCGISIILWNLTKDRVPAWGFMAIILAFVALIETCRQRERLNALIKLQEIENHNISEQSGADYDPQVRLYLTPYQNVIL